MTSHATLRAAAGVMIQRLRSCDLPSLWQAGANLMTFVASDLQMLRVAETHFECLHRLRRTGITAQLMASAARGNVAPARLRVWRMTAITGRVGIESRRNRHRDARARRAMTSRTIYAAHRHVSRMIEFHAKALQARKRFERARLYIGMTDRADRTFGI